MDSFSLVPIGYVSFIPARYHDRFWHVGMMVDLMSVKSHYYAIRNSVDLAVLVSSVCLLLVSDEADHNTGWGLRDVPYQSGIFGTMPTAAGTFTDSIPLGETSVSNCTTQNRCVGLSVYICERLCHSVICNSK